MFRRPILLHSQLCHARSKLHDWHWSKTGIKYSIWRLVQTIIPWVGSGLHIITNHKIMPQGAQEVLRISKFILSLVPPEFVSALVICFPISFFVCSSRIHCVASKHLISIWFSCCICRCCCCHHQHQRQCSSFTRRTHLNNCQPIAPASAPPSLHLIASFLLCVCCCYFTMLFAIIRCFQIRWYVDTWRFASFLVCWVSSVLLSLWRRRRRHLLVACSNF